MPISARTTSSRPSNRQPRRRSRRSPRPWPCSVPVDGPRLEVLDPPDRQPRAVAWRPDPAELEEPDHERPAASIRLEQLEHPLVRAPWLAGQRERDEVLEVEVADAHRVLVAERPHTDLGRGP